jgi:hypothetical protein
MSKKRAKKNACKHAEPVTPGRTAQASEHWAGKLLTSGWNQNAVVSAIFLVIGAVSTSVIKRPRIVAIACGIILSLAVLWKFILLVLVTRRSLVKGTVAFTGISTMVLIWIGVSWWVREISKAEPKVEFRAHVMAQEPPYPPNTTIGGLSFGKGDADIRLEFETGSVPIYALDFNVQIDRSIRPTLILGIGKLEGFSEIKCEPAQSVQLAAQTLNSQGIRSTISLEPVSTADNVTMGPGIASVFRIRCPEIPHDSKLRLAVQARPLGAAAEKWKPRRLDIVGTYEFQNGSGVESVAFTNGFLLPSTNP